MTATLDAIAATACDETFPRRRPPRRLEQRGLLQDDARRRLCAASYLSATRRPSHTPSTQVISKTLIHLMERPPGRTSRHIERIIGAQKRLRLQDLLILATDTESLHPDIDTDIVLSTDFAEIHPWLVVWHGNEIPVLQYLHDHNYVCCRV